MTGKGAAGNRPWIEASKSKIKGGRLFIVGVDGLKGYIIARLARGKTIRFADDIPRVWFEQLASERLVVRYSRGQPAHRFERVPGRAAEGLDCLIYAFAARQLVTINWRQRADEMRLVAPAATRPRNVIKSGWMSA